MASLALDAAASVSSSVFTAREASTIKKALGIIEAKRLKDAPILHYLEDFERYLVLRFAGRTNEEGHVLYLDISRCLLTAETEFFGDHCSVAFDLRRIALRAITLGADSVVFAHNHPSGNREPSDADLRHLDYSESALSPLGITLLDSFVVTSTGITSIKTRREHIAEMRRRELHAEWERRSRERSAKIAATKAAKRAAQQQGVHHV